MLFVSRQHQDVIMHPFNEELTMSKTSQKIQEQALLARVSIKKWSNAKTDAELTVEVSASNNVDPGLLRVRKTLLSVPVVNALSKLAGQIRNNIVGKLTVPWDEDGTRLLPVGVIDRFEKELAEAQDRWEELKKELGNDYDDAVKESKSALGDAFKESDYPQREDILDRYSINVEYSPLPTGGDLRVSLPQKKLDKLRREVEARVKSNIEKGTKQVHERVVKTLTHLIEKLEKFGIDKNSGKVVGAFRDSTVENLNELAEVLSVLNITGDPALTAASNDLLAQLRDLNPKKLRSNPTHRKDVAKKAQKIVDNLSGYYD